MLYRLLLAAGCPFQRAHSDSKDKPVVRFFNRDLAAVLNFRHIVLRLRNTDDIPERFKRKTSIPKLRQLPPMPEREHTKVQTHNARRRSVHRLHRCTLRQELREQQRRQELQEHRQ
ncbi:hypothetical protein EV175_002671 [Coemansia sp. RSA 1933]|nr:hypothetical protein EV175_002671 [Coemansia sp. RSA 1933]